MDISPQNVLCCFQRAPFVYKGEVVRKPKRLSLDVWAAMNRGLYEIGKYMLETYGVFEE